MNKAKLWAGILLGLVLTAIIALLLGEEHLWLTAGICAVLGLLCLWGGCRKKVVSCLLASAIVASPNALLAEDSYAGYNGQQCYCFTPAAEDPNPPAQESFTLDFILGPNPDGIIEPSILSLRHPDPALLVSYDEMNASLAAWGLDLNGGEQYAKNGQPTTVDQVPFVFGDWSAPLTLFPDREQYRVVIEVANGLDQTWTFWQPVAHFSVPAGVRIRFQDSPEGSQTFYRVRLEAPPEDFQAAGPVVIGCGLGLLVGAGVICVLAVRACARNKKKFEKMLPPKETNAPPPEVRMPLPPLLNLPPVLK